MVEIKIANAQAFNSAIRKFRDSIAPASIELFIRTLAFKIYRGVVLKTPVGDPSKWNPPRSPRGYTGGTARANWQISVGSYNTNVLSEKNTGGINLSDAIAAIGKLANFGIGQIIYIFNNVPYILRLEAGWSKNQAPNGMIGVTFAELKASLA